MIEFCRVFVDKDECGNAIERYVPLFQRAASGEVVFLPDSVQPDILAPMRAHVKILRRDGERKSERDISADPGTRGDMTMVRVGDRTELKLAAPDDSQMKPIVPVLYHARLVTMHGNRMLFHGLTAPREEGGIPQEWAVEALGA